jgi:hypothetical protein
MENTIDKMNELNLNELVAAITAPPGEEVLKLRSKVIENKYRWNKNSLLSGNMLEFKMPLIELVISLLFRTGADFLTFSALSTGEVTECNIKMGVAL